MKKLYLTLTFLFILNLSFANPISGNSNQPGLKESVIAFVGSFIALTILFYIVTNGFQKIRHKDFEISWITKK